jgi:quercetin dioxygenase-like cupin family protein
MFKRFVTAQDTEREKLSWGTLAWISRPALTGAKLLTVLEATLTEGNGHNFHKHPDQEELIYIISGQVEQWLETERRILGAGDSIFIPKGVVHSTFNVFPEEAKTLAILSPCVGAEGYESVDVSTQAPWSTLRAR